MPLVDRRCRTQNGGGNGEDRGQGNRVADFGDGKPTAHHRFGREGGATQDARQRPKAAVGRRRKCAG